MSIDSADQKEACKACAQLVPFGLMLEYFLATEKTPEKWETLQFCSQFLNQDTVLDSSVAFRNYFFGKALMVATEKDQLFQVFSFKHQMELQIRLSDSLPLSQIFTAYLAYAEGIISK